MQKWYYFSAVSDDNDVVAMTTETHKVCVWKQYPMSDYNTVFKIFIWAIWICDWQTSSIVGFYKNKSKPFV